MTELLVQLAAALMLTIAIELAVVWALGARTPDELWAVTLVNLMTNPALNVGLFVVRLTVVPALQPSAAALAQWLFVGVAEVVVVLVEWRLLVWTLRAESRTWLWRSVAMNAASFVLGSWLLAVGLSALAR